MLREYAKLTASSSAGLVLLGVALGTSLPRTALALDEDPFTSGAHWIVVGVTCAIVVVCVVIHYEVLTGLTRLVQRMHSRDRPRVLVLIFGILSASFTFLEMQRFWKGN